MTISERRRIGAANADAQVYLIQKLRDIRINRGIQVADVAVSMGVDAAMVYRFEKGGTNYTAATLRKYARAVGALLHFDATDASLAADQLDAQNADMVDTVYDYHVAHGHVSVKFTPTTQADQDKTSTQPTSSSSSQSMGSWAERFVSLHARLESAAY